MDLGKALGQLGQMFKMLGTAALLQLASSLEKQLGDELGSLDPRRRKKIGDKWRAELQACVPKPTTGEPAPAESLDAKAVAKITAAISQAVIEAQPGPALAAWKAATQAAGWGPLQRFTLLQRVLPDAPIQINNLQIGNISVASAGKPLETPAVPGKPEDESDKTKPPSDELPS